MKKLLILLALVATSFAPAFSAGLLHPADGSAALTIEEHRVKVVINNVFAVTEVDQTFRNPGDRDLDAIYTFPLPRQASLSELSLWIDGVEIVGEVVEKQRARKIAEEEKEAGRETALAEKRGYVAFDVYVSPVRAGSTVRVRLLYLQPIEIDGGIGRYVYPLQEGEIDEQEASFWDRREKVEGKFSFEATIRSSYPLDDVRTKGLGAPTVTQEANGEWKIWIDSAETETELNRDIVLYYRLAEGLPARVDLLPYRRGDEPGTYMLVVTPGTDLRPTVDGVDWTVVLDVSGSMSSKISAATDAVARALNQMRAADRFRVITFADSPRNILGGFSGVDAETVRSAGERVKNEGARGGTNLYAGFSAGLRGLDQDRPNAVLLISDGGANIGPTEFSAFAKLLEKTDIRVFTFVMGQGSNRPLLESIAESSGGFSMDISNEDDLYGRLMQARDKLGREALHGVALELKGVGLNDVTPKRMPSAYFGQQIVQFGRYTRPGETTLRLKGRISGEEQVWETKIELPAEDLRFPEIERLWALSRIDDMQQSIGRGEPESEYRGAIVDVATNYSIVSDYTSMIVMREEQFAERGIDRINKRRVTNERAARQQRAQVSIPATRADPARPMFRDKKSHSTGGGGGVGASGPLFLGLLAGLGGIRAWVTQRRNRS